LTKAKISDYDSGSLATVRDRIHGYRAKFGRPEHSRPPDPLLCAQLLALAGDQARIEGMLLDLGAERKEPGYSDGWFITVALQRMTGAHPALIKQRRAALAPARKPPIPQQFNNGQAQAATGDKPPAPELGDLRRAMAAAAAAKGMR
jgi:hypothetical protein